LLNTKVRVIRSDSPPPEREVDLHEIAAGQHRARRSWCGIAELAPAATMVSKDHPVRRRGRAYRNFRSRPTSSRSGGPQSTATDQIRQRGVGGLAGQAQQRHLAVVLTSRRPSTIPRRDQFGPGAVLE